MGIIKHSGENADDARDRGAGRKYHGSGPQKRLTRLAGDKQFSWGKKPTQGFLGGGKSRPKNKQD